MPSKDRLSGVGASNWSTAVVLLVATLTPLLIYALVSTGLGYRDDRRAIEAATLARAVRISDGVDARLESVEATMRALATIRSIGKRDWKEAHDRMAEIAALDPDWRDVKLADAATGRTLVELNARPASGRHSDEDGIPLSSVSSAGRPIFSGVSRGPDGTPELTGSMIVGSGPGTRYLLCVYLDPRLAQRVLLASAPTDGVSAVVDTAGLFIARSKAWSARVGKPATRYVREAIRNGKSGIYRGVTYEGLESYTAFTTSTRTGWSVHVAVSASALDAPQYGYRLAATLAGLTGLALAVALVVVILRLVGARRAADERTRHNERLEAVGKLTGGIAHDFNNMLAVVIGSLDLAQRRLAKGNTDILRNIDNAMDGAHRAAELTRRLLAFSRQQPLAPMAVDVNRLISSTSELLRQTLAANIRIDMQLSQELWPTFVDPGQLENALVNLAVNARDAMPEGGALTIATSNRAAPRPMVVITVADTGTGMPADVAARAFEPFYTTKDVGQGTGLGLSQIHGFAMQSGGDVSIFSQLGQGTTVTLLLPRYEGEVSRLGRADGRTDQLAPPGSTDEIVLVVEDEEAVRRMNVEALRSLGYTVRHAVDAKEALVLLETQPGIRLLLTDIVMPGMNGRKLAERVARAYPDIRILFVTGYEREEMDVDEARMLRKPFSISELARRVRQELDPVA